MAHHIKRILFVCTGNSCRSVMAEGLLKKYLSEKGRTDVEVFSSGIATIPGSPPTATTVQVMKNEGVDVSNYKSASLSTDLINKSDLILVMDEIHKNEVLRLVPQAKDKTHLLKEFVKDEGVKSDFSVQDPIGKPLEVYERVLMEIKEAVQKLLSKI